MPVRVVTVGGVTTVVTTTFRQCPQYGMVESVTIDLPQKLDDKAIARRLQLLAIMKDSETGKNPYTGETSRNMVPDFPILDPAINIPD